jgi:hypothetical protein
VSPSLSCIRPTPMLSRASRLRYHVACPSAIGFAPCPLPRTASTETIGVGRTVRLSAPPALHCVTLGLSGRTGPTTRGTRYRGMTTYNRTSGYSSGHRNLPLPEGTARATAEPMRRRAITRHWLTGSIAFRLMRMQGTVPTALPAWNRRRAV